jgi:hypothetical protein
MSPGILPLAPTRDGIAIDSALRIACATEHAMYTRLLGPRKNMATESYTPGRRATPTWEGTMRLPQSPRVTGDGGGVCSLEEHGWQQVLGCLGSG